MWESQFFMAVDLFLLLAVPLQTELNISQKELLLWLL